ncbi:unnamed protein product [Caenorhabditis sp. 36 PRJEB53466]|nr:unnamed protein product [Caenorhabditis sp. 36 PRJEB53466]
MNQLYNILLISSALLAAVAAASDCQLSCPDGYLSFSRTPTVNNSRTTLWCVKPIFSQDPINVVAAKALCAKESAVLTAFENDAERQQILSALKTAITSYSQSVGSLIIDGHRTTQCYTQDTAVLGAAPCNYPGTTFVVDDKHTDPTFMLQNFADTEPSGTFYQTELESCLALSISAFPKRSGGINDFLCNYAKSPLGTDTIEFWNFGVLCGKLPQFA